MLGRTEDRVDGANSVRIVGWIDGDKEARMLPCIVRKPRNVQKLHPMGYTWAKEPAQLPSCGKRRTARAFPQPGDACVRTRRHATGLCTNDDRFRLVGKPRSRSTVSNIGSTTNGVACIAPTISA